MSSLPFELVDIIVDHLDFPDWKTCSLISLIWRAPAQIRLFRYCYTETVQQIHRLYYILLESPHLADYIHYPSFKIDHQITARVTAAILPLLKRIIRLVIFCGKWTWPGDQPHELSHTLFKPVTSTLVHHPVTTLWLGGFSLAVADLQDLLANTPLLEELYITNFITRAFDNRPLMKASSRPKLRYLRITFTMESFLMGEWLCNPLCSVDLSRVQFLDFDYEPDGNGHVVNLVSRVLKLIGRSASDIIVRREIKDGSQEPQGIPINFSHNQMRRLTLDLTPYTCWDPMACPPQWVESSIIRLPKPSPIEELIVLLEIVPKPPIVLLGNQQAGVPPHIGWARMASLLTEESFPKLRSVIIVSTLNGILRHCHEKIAQQQMGSMGMKWAFEMSDLYGRPNLGRKESENLE